MKTLAQLIAWDFRLQIKYNIVAISVIIASLYILVLKSLPYTSLDYLSILLVLSDPTMFGTLFIGVLVLYEKDNNTLNALIVSPLKPYQYLLSKAISLTIIAVPIALAIALFGHGTDLNYFIFLSSVALTSIIFILLGFVVVSNAKGFNQYIIKFALFTLPVALPFLGFFNVINSFIFYIIPTQATILLLKQSFNYSITTWEFVYAFAYLIVWIFISYHLAIRAFYRNLLNGKL